MIITTTAVLVIAGYGHEAGAATARRGRAYAVLVAALVLVAIPMVVNSLTTLWAGQIADAAEDWLRDSPGAEVTDVTLHSDTATISVLGPEELPPVEDLHRAVDDLVPWNPGVVVVHTVGNRVSDR